MTPKGSYIKPDGTIVWGAVPSKEVLDFHNSSDVDSGALAQHHTLGKGAMQAAPGDHTHKGKYDVSNLLLAGDSSWSHNSRLWRRGNLVHIRVRVSTSVNQPSSARCFDIPLEHLPIGLSTGDAEIFQLWDSSGNPPLYFFCRATGVCSFDAARAAGTTSIGTMVYMAGD